ncbi:MULTISPECIES: DUF7144 family membrane protein [unclassified Geodermatophilus]|uniref:DUF7144 family membrane protein n=1 Tax=unclassified Geodermatophilus TaxID=2637632 RepID=UPI003EEA0732
MNETSQPHQEANWQAQARIGVYGGPSDRPTGWAAWIVFAAVLLTVSGLFAVMQGLTALLNDDFYQVGASDLIVDSDYAVWGWVHLVLGVVAMVTAWGLQRGNTVARVAGIAIAVLSILVNLAFLRAYPWWSTIVIAFDVVVIYAISVHGDEVRGSA